MIKLENTYLHLPEIFYTRVNPTPVVNPQMLLFNSKLAAELGLDAEVLSRQPEIFSGNKILEGSTPIAQAYAGHQFGHFNILGDGRAHLLGEIIDLKNQRWDVQLKGSGQTPYSRQGDGRAALGPMLREYIISEALTGLGIPSTRSLAVVLSGEPVYRETVLPGAILTRVAASHLRVGTFEWALYQGGRDAVCVLADYAIARHYPELLKEKNIYLAFLEAVIEKQTRLVAQWMNSGFIHGVMNTDNMTISGESIDFGPCAFMDEYDPRTVFSSIDREGRYAYGNQPAIAHWNLTRLAETLLPILADNVDEAKALAETALDTFKDRFRYFYFTQIRAKFGLTSIDENDQSLFEEFFALMALHRADYTFTFYALSRSEQQNNGLFLSEDFRNWRNQWTLRLQKEDYPLGEAVTLMKNTNPAVVARNWLVEEALSLAIEKNDFDAVKKLINALQSPFDENPENEKYRKIPRGHSKNYQTFCGT